MAGRVLLHMQIEASLKQWLQKLQEYQFTIIHHPGNHHNNADALSMLPCKQCGIIPADELTTVVAVTTSDLTSTITYPLEEL